MSYHVFLEPGTKVEYITTRAHGPYPAGTKCLAERVFTSPRTFARLTLTFSDGVTIELDRQYYLQGHEPLIPDVINLAM